MKNAMFIFLYLPLQLFANMPDIDDLPWIHASDYEAINFVEPYLPENPVIIEAGVCDAEDTHRMKKLWPNATVHGFEPHPDLFIRATNETQYMKNVTIYPLALFNKVGTMIFYVSSKIPAASSLLVDNLDNVEIPEDMEHDGRNYQDTPITVNCTTLDFWAETEKVDVVDFIWLDTEGAELYILQSGKSLLTNVKVICTEANFKVFRQGMTQFPELYDFLIEQGFTLKYIWGRSDWQGVAIFVKSNLII